MLCFLLSSSLNLLVELGIQLDISIPSVLFFVGIYCNFNDSDKERALVEHRTSASNQATKRSASLWESIKGVLGYASVAVRFYSSDFQS